jgi:hypothetical protein
VQRLTEFQSPEGYEYEALELNIACPRGPSGGPVFDPERPDRVLGLVTTNRESYTLATRETRDERKGSEAFEVHVTEERAIINYDIALHLDASMDWFNVHVPRRGGPLFEEQPSAPPISGGALTFDAVEAAHVFMAHAADIWYACKIAPDNTVVRAEVEYTGRSFAVAPVPLSTGAPIHRRTGPLPSPWFVEFGPKSDMRGIHDTIEEWLAVGGYTQLTLLEGNASGYIAWARSQWRRQSDRG